jgi:AraC-like DNA-binding protein
VPDKRLIPEKPSPKLPGKAGIVAPIVTSVIDSLGVAASFYLAPTERAHGAWFPIRSGVGIMALEHHARKLPLRWSRDERVLLRVRREGRTIVDEHSGFFDCFVPVGNEGKTFVSLVVGPFARERATSAEIRQRFLAIVGRPAHASDPIFMDYVNRTLATLTLTGEHFDSFHRYLECFAALAHGAKDMEPLVRELDELSPKVLAARSVEDMWKQTHDLLGERQGGPDPGNPGELWRVGLERFPEHVMVGLVRERGKDRDPIDALVARDAFQRAAVELAKARGRVMCGKHGAHGVVFLIDDPGGAARQKARAVAFAERAKDLARRFDLALHAGLAVSDKPSLLSRQYERALALAEQAFAEGVPMRHADRGPQPTSGSLGKMRTELARAVIETPATLARQFESFIEAMRIHCGFQLEPARVHLEVAFDQVLSALDSLHVLDASSLRDVAVPVEREARHADTMLALEDVYRSAIAEVARVLEYPATGRQRLGLERAIDYARDHLIEPLGIAKVSRLAGYVPRHFTELFRASQGTTFHRYVLKLRLERAQSLLRSTSLSSKSIAPLAGFASSEQFHRAFKRAFRLTPHEYRTRQRRPPGF